MSSRAASGPVETRLLALVRAPRYADAFRHAYWSALIHDATEDGALLVLDIDLKLQWGDYQGQSPDATNFIEDGSESLPGQDRLAFGVDDSVTTFWEQQQK